MATNASGYTNWKAPENDRQWLIWPPPADLLRDTLENSRLLRSSGIETIDADARTLSPRLVNRYLALKRRARL